MIKKELENSFSLSVIMNYGEECILNLAPRAKPVPFCRPTHVSKFNPSVIEFYQSNLEANKTMGKSKVSRPNPKNHLTKGGTYENVMMKSIQENVENVKRNTKNPKNLKKPGVPSVSILKHGWKKSPHKTTNKIVENG